jgi:hypothetical protein
MTTISPTLRCSYLLVIAFLRIDVCTSFALPSRTASSTKRHDAFLPASPPLLLMAKKDDEEKQDPGMAAAFRQFNSLERLGEEDEEAESQKPKPIDRSNIDLESTKTEIVSPEKEVQLYKEMVQELEHTNEDDLYSNILAGGSMESCDEYLLYMHFSDPVRSSLYYTLDMGGTPTEKKAKSSPPTPSVTVNDEITQQKTPEEFMNQALDEALKDVKVNNPSSVDSILDDKEIMKEIGAIFERGNEKLMENLAEMRREQVRLCLLSLERHSVVVLHISATHTCLTSVCNSKS